MDSYEELPIRQIVPDDSPYLPLVSLCYQLRSENEELQKTVSLKDDLVEVCEKEVEAVRLKMKAAEKQTSDELERVVGHQIETASDRFRLLNENIRLESLVHEKEMLVATLQRKVEGLLRQTEICAEVTTPPVPIIPVRDPTIKLNEEIRRLKSELATFSYIQSALQRKLEVRLEDEENRSKRARTDSLLHALESIVGWKISEGEGTEIFQLRGDGDLTVQVKQGPDGTFSIDTSSEPDEEALSDPRPPNTSATSVCLAKTLLGRE